jgi:hypothetical protein
LTKTILSPRLFCAIVASATLFCGAAHADGTNDPAKARADCQKQGRATTPTELKECCADYILVADMRRQRQLEAQCASGGNSKPAAKPTKAGGSS